jgi:hypothetical protein
LQPYYDPVRFEINNQLFEQEVQFDKQMRNKKIELAQTKNFIRELRSKEKLIKVGLERKAKREKIELDK